MSRESSPGTVAEPEELESPPLSAETEAAVLAALEAALRPEALDPATNERLLELALLDPLSPASEEELVESARLRDALDSAAHGRAEPGAAEHEDAPVLRALTAAFGAESSDTPAATSAAETAAEQALPPALKPESRTGNVVYVAFGAVSLALAAAAAVLLTFTARVPLGDSAAEPATATLIKPHSTAPLFSDRFDTGGTTARMDLIASERARDLRDNRFTAWGVR